MCVKILVFLRPSLQIASQCARDSGEAAGDVSSMYSTPNSSRLARQRKLPSKHGGWGEAKMDRVEDEWTHALAILILVSRVKKALANCSPSTTRQ